MSEAIPEVGYAVVVGNMIVNYHDHGQGEPILLIHGSGPGVTAWANWRLVIPELAKTHRVIALDMAGFGYTYTPPSFEATPENWAAQVVGLMDELRIEKCAILGNSFGGAIALRVASDYPERVTRLVLMGSVGTSFPISDGLEKVWGYEPSHEAMRELIGVFAYDNAFVTDDLVDMRYRASIRDDVQERFSKLFPPPRQNGIEMLSLSDEALRRIAAPTILIHGRDDRVIPFAVSEMLAKKLPQATLYPIDRCGHWVQIEKKAEFLDIVTRFMEQRV
ncbi:alpha/beta fold hydrolase [Pandoraea nosoerga]|uniref:2-hydroxy-6-oxo-2,4-heptadienoate hydrolase n=1 Tax=Pandoraea nosoerga TaxID=2508296 RepID=A0A5E4W4D1_9BURK|nr:alpha/beta fold hydrolase [Pandoraea nosoerga]VVE17965.1 2-hydroxy-6-oxo-2,4-heptadienoate hydrolase [Pandoraea nosoerga]